MSKAKYEVGQLVDVRTGHRSRSGVLVESVRWLEKDTLVNLTDSGKTGPLLNGAYFYRIEGFDSYIIELDVFPHNKPADDEFTQDFMKLIAPKKASETA